MVRFDFMQVPLKSKKDAMEFIHQLADEGLMFHFEDDPKDIITVNDPVESVNERGEGQLFTNEEVALLRDRLDEMYDIWDDDDCCPIRYVMCRIHRDKDLCCGACDH